MVGKYKLELVTKRLRYIFEVKRKYTVIRGDSGTGKTTFVNYVLEHQLHGSSSGVYLNCDVPVKRVTSLEDFQSFSNCILVMDEGDMFFRGRDIASYFTESNNYFILVTREELGYLPYSYKEIYEIVSGRVQGKFFESKFVNKYADVTQSMLPDLVITEDSGTGLKLFDYFLSCTCKSACGKDNVASEMKLAIQQGYSSILVVCDGAAIGSETEKIMEVLHNSPSDVKICVAVPESFEWLILSSSLFNFGTVRKKLQATYEYCDASQFDSWEQYFTKLLIDTAKGYNISYSKDNMSRYFYDNGLAILKCLPELNMNSIKSELRNK